MKIIVLILLLDVMICIFMSAKYGDLGVVKNTLFAIIFSSMIIFGLTHKNSMYGFVLRTKMLVWIGTISYSLYLFHDILLGVCRRIAGGGDENWLETAKGGLVTIIALAVSIGFSWLIYQKLEKPFVRYGKRFNY